METIDNKIAASGLVNLELDAYYPKGECSILDIKDRLWQGLVLREKDFRNWVKEHDWRQYKDRHVAIFCSVDAIVPQWAYMLIASELFPFANTIVFGDVLALQARIWADALDGLNANDYVDKRVLVKGCSDKPIPACAYVEIVRRLQPVVKSLMFGEACSSVPVFKQKK